MTEVKQIYPNCDLKFNSNFTVIQNKFQNYIKISSFCQTLILLKPFESYESSKG